MMKQIKKMAVYLAAAILALSVLAACGGRTPLNIKYDTEKQTIAENALSEYLTENNLLMEKNATMMQDAKKGLEPAVAYIRGVLDKNSSAMEIYSKVSMNANELQACYNEHRFIRIEIKEDEYSQQAVLEQLKNQMKKVSAQTLPTKYGICVGAYDGTVYVAMFMA